MALKKNNVAISLMLNHNSTGLQRNQYLSFNYVMITWNLNCTYDKFIYFCNLVTEVAVGIIKPSVAEAVLFLKILG